jgi:hypothetical protein
MTLATTSWTEYANSTWSDFTLNAWNNSGLPSLSHPRQRSYFHGRFPPGMTSKKGKNKCKNKVGGDS